MTFQLEDIPLFHSTATYLIHNFPLVQVLALAKIMSLSMGEAESQLVEGLTCSSREDGNLRTCGNLD